jgi:uncharacterized protein (DUF952 family)
MGRIGEGRWHHAAMRTTFHLLPADTWATADTGRPYQAPTLATEGFIHCTDGADEVIATANRYYRHDPRAYVVLTIDLDAAGSRWTIDDPSGIYPHLHGPVARRAIVRVQAAVRDPDGTFTGLVDRPAAPSTGRPG